MGRKPRVKTLEQYDRDREKFNWKEAHTQLSRDTSKSRGNFPAGQGMSQERWDSIFGKKKRKSPLRRWVSKNEKWQVSYRKGEETVIITDLKTKDAFEVYLNPSPHTKKKRPLAGETKRFHYMPKWQTQMPYWGSCVPKYVQKIALEILERITNAE